jgi:DNA-binding Lrp family transcriptional regulator
MVTAIVLIRVECARVEETAQALLELNEVKEVYSVTGDYDLVAIVRVRRYEQMADVVPRKMAAVPGLLQTKTLMAFQCYSRHDLERLWDLGLEDERAARVSQPAEPPED